MIIYISHDNCYTVKRFLKLWAPELREKISFIYYADLVHRSTLPRQLSIFMDLERLSDAQIQLASEAAQGLQNAGVPVLNEPHRVLARYALLRVLHEDGVNSFNVYRPDDDQSRMGFPVFLRLENEHQGNLSELLETPEELEAAFAAATGKGVPRDELLIVEFCNSVDDEGIVRKYSAFLIGDHFHPRHLLFSRAWMLKYPDLVDQAKVREELAYLEEEPHSHESKVRAVFERAAIDYGRIDYSVVAGKLQVWEINTNPSIVPESAIAPSREKTQALVRRNVRESFLKLTQQFEGTRDRVSFRASAEVRRELQTGPGERLFHPLLRATRPLNPQRVRRFVASKLKPRKHPST